jgi:hypothetical protein
VAKKKRKQRRARVPGADPPRPAARPAVRREPPEPSRSARAERKELARLERERARKAVARARTIRRVTTLGIVGAAIGVGAFLLFRVASPGAVAAEALELGRELGCTDVQTPAGSAPGGQHLAPGESAGYTEFPASSGLHDAFTLPAEPEVHTTPVREETAVHNLEHGYVMLYYRAEGEEALDQAVVDRLAQIAEDESKVMLAPHPQLDAGTSLAMVAWNKVWECPAAVSPADAATMAQAFIQAYRGTSNAPEGTVPE